MATIERLLLKTSWETLAAVIAGMRVRVIALDPTAMITAGCQRQEQSG